MKIGLISDTHLPDRCDILPPAVFQALQGVDLVLHAGDVGELSVLDQLSAIAPVVAVHGNDELADAPQHLPYQQVVVVNGTRIVLTNGHYADRSKELASRKNDAWGPKLDRWAAFGRQASAAVVVFGHTHIPMALEWDGLLLVNPGAIAPPNYTTHQALQSVATLTVGDDGSLSVAHIDLATPEQPFAPSNDISLGFRSLFARYTASLLGPDLADYPHMLAVWHELLPETQLRNVLRRAAWPCWSGQRRALAAADLRAALLAEPDVAADIRARLLEEIHP